MRIYLLPISTRRTLLFAHRLAAAAPQSHETWLEKVQGKAAKTWTGWEQKESGWQKTIVNYGNHALKRISYEEWGLKSIPPLSTKRKDDEMRGDDKVEVIYPQTVMPGNKVTDVLNVLSTEREGLHRQRLIWCLIGMPISAPFALVPVVPNIPFFYLVYRAWSHWRALCGGKHIQFLLEKKLLVFTPSQILDQFYSSQDPPLPSTPESTAEPGEPKNTSPQLPEDDQPGGEVMLLSQANGKKMTQALEMPQLEVELERALWQVEQAIQTQNAERDAAKSSKDDPTKKDDPKSQ